MTKTAPDWRTVGPNYGVPDVALGWPLRNSRSPAEVVDLRDVPSLADLVQALTEIW
jgi:putative aminopeptidase FrvX